MIFQVISVRDLPPREQEREEAMPLAKRQRTAAEESAAEEGSQGSAAGPSGTTAAEEELEELAAAAAEKQVALLWEHSMHLLLPVAVHLGRDRVLVPLLRRWARRLEGSTALELDLHSPDTVFKVGAAAQGVPPAQRAASFWRVGRPGATT